jgi:16S rRNA (guanine527-N7)-methyltransferase
MMVSGEQVCELLAPFGLKLSSSQIAKLLTYLDLLLRWNTKINLTAIRSPEECITRHFGESLYPARFAQLEGSLLDIGSGAGFPGLALMIAFPELQVTLLEPVGKKRAFLKEVARLCEMLQSVEVRSDRLDEFVLFGKGSALFDAATSRAVGELRNLVPKAVRCLKPSGSLFLWLSQDQGKEAAAGGRNLIEWTDPIPIPLARQRQIWWGRRRIRFETNPRCFVKSIT